MCSNLKTMNLSFAGCGFLGIYHIGVACCFKQYAPLLFHNKIAGASAGAIAACSLLCDLPIGDIISDVLRVVSDARKRTLGPFSPSFNVQGLLLEGLEKFLPEDAHVRVSGKLRISLTRVYDGKNVIVTDFNTKQELLEALLCSAFVPVFSGLFPPKFKGTRYMDGGFSDNLPTFDENTITVSPFCGESDICPRDLSSQLFHVNVANTSIELSRQNIYRIARILFPPKPETLSNMCKQGFDDALRFLHRNDLISCTSCLSVQSTIVVQDNIDDSCEYDPECTECKQHRQEALVANLPDTVLTVFQDAIDTANKGLVNWVFKHKGMKLLSILSLPYILPFELVYATFNKLLSCGPWIGSNVQAASQAILESLSSVLKRVDKQRQELSASIICQLAVTQYSDFNLDLDGFHEARTKNQVINFTVDLDKGMVDPVSSLGNKILSRRSSLVLHKGDHLDVGADTYDQILKVTSHHDAVMAYYYMDENNKVKVTEIFDVTSAESAAIFHKQGDTTNMADSTDSVSHSHSHSHSHKHKFHGWQTHTPSWTSAEKDNSVSGLSDDSGDYTFDMDNTGLFSDPESEWTPSISKQMDSEPDMRPESDQSTLTEIKPLSRRPSYAILS